MAVRYAVATGNWSNVATWDGGTTLPTTGDEVRSNTYTVTIDQDITVQDISTRAQGSASAGGGFVVSSMTTRSITANILPGTTVVLTVSATSGTLTITGNVGIYTYGGVTTMAVSGTGCTVNITGDVVGGGNQGVYGINVTAVCTLNITGTVNGGNGGNSNQTAAGLFINAAAAVTVTGTVTGRNNPGNGGFGIYANTNCVIDVIGTIQLPTDTFSSGYIPWAISVLGTLYAVIIRVDGTIKSHPLGYWPISGNARIQFPSGSNLVVEMRDDSASPSAGVAKTLSVLGSTNPATADVRSGTTYGTGGTSTGTLAVPNPASVALGVATDNTTGTAALTPSAVWNHLLASIATADSIGVRLKTAATVDSTGAQIAAALDTP